jgi:hypothetical protein
MEKILDTLRRPSGSAGWKEVEESPFFAFSCQQKEEEERKRVDVMFRLFESTVVVGYCIAWYAMI